MSPPPRRRSRKAAAARGGNRVTRHVRLGRIPDRPHPFGLECGHGHGGSPTGPRAARFGDDLPVVGGRGRAADAAQQPGPRGRRETGRPRRLRRVGAGRPQLGGLRQDRRVAARDGAGRHPARAVGQAGGGGAHPRDGPARADRELAAGAQVGDAGALPRARGRRPDDVRPDDGGVLDLHRHPGDPAGHLRHVHRGRQPALRRVAARHHHPDRWSRRDGRRAAARGHRQRRGRAVHRGRPLAGAAPARPRLPRRDRRLPR